jgi:hypothetical protein
MLRFTRIVAVSGGIALAAGLVPAQAANLEALEADSGQCVAQGVCFVADSSWDITPFGQTNYDPAHDLVTGFGAFSSFAPASGNQTLYITAADGSTVIDILSTQFSDMGTAGNNGGTVEDATVSWQASDNGAIDLGSVPLGGTSIMGNGSLQNVTPLLGGLGGFPGTITIEAQDFVPAPEPASLTLLGAGLAGLGLIRRFRRK